MPLRILAISFLIACDGAAPPAVDISARDLGPMEQNSAIQARDGGYSARLWDESIWVYGDSILSVQGEDGTSWRNNTWSRTPDLDAADGITGFVEPVDALGAPRELLPQTDVERAFNDAHREPDCVDPCGARWALWPGPVVYDPDGDRALIVYTKIYGEPGEWNFHSVGVGIATWAGLDEPVLRPVLDPDAEHPTLLWPGEDAGLGSAAVVDDGYLYLFGCHGTDKGCRLGRAPLARVLDRTAWRYYAPGATWSEDPDDAIELFEAMDMTTVHWNDYLDAWVAIYSPPFANRIELRTAPALTGPWSGPAHAADLEPPGDDSAAYSGLGHAEYAAGGGRIEYVSYYRTTRPWFGEIRLVELELNRR